jgi:hypothetical protein
MIGIVYPIILSAFFFFATLILLILKKLRSPRFLEWSILIPVILALIYWFFTAPDPRFANSLFLLIPICVILLLLSSIQRVVKRQVFIGLVFLTFVLGNSNFIYFAISHRYIFKQISVSGYQSIKQVPLVKKITQSGLTVYTPETGDQCWDAPLPCTPYFKTFLELREPGNLASGFKVTK